MQITDIDLPFDGSAMRQLGQIGAGKALRGKLTVPMDAKPLGNGSVSYYDYGTSRFPAGVGFSKDPDHWVKPPYRIAEGTFHYQIGGTPPPGTSVMVIQPGDVWYVTVNNQHADGTNGSGGHQIALEVHPTY